MAFEGKGIACPQRKSLLRSLTQLKLSGVTRWDAPQSSGFSVSPEIAEEYERLTARQGTTRSELFRRMVETYKTKLEEEEFSRLQKKMSGKARKQGIFTEKEVERIVFGDR